MKQFKAKVTDAYDIKGKTGTTVSLEWIEKAPLAVGDRIISETGEETVVTGILMLNPYREDILGITIRTNFEEAKALIGKTMTKKIS